MKCVIGIDLGGTNLRIGLADSSGRLISKKVMPLERDKSPKGIISLILSETSRFIKDAPSNVVAVGCGIAGIVNFENGVVVRSPNLPEWIDVRARDEISSALGLPVLLDNDANLYALCELRLGAGRGPAPYGTGRGHKNLVLLTLGTGIGGGLIVDGEVFHGDRGYAGEVGHITVEAGGERCGCGAKGCLEQYAASRAFRVHASRLPEAERKAVLSSAGVELDGLTPELVAKLANSGDEIAQKLWNSFGTYLGIGIASLINVLGITTFVVGGGIAGSWRLFEEATKASIARHTYEENVKSLIITPSRLGDDAGIMGAVLAALSLAGCHSKRRDR